MTKDERFSCVITDYWNALYKTRWSKHDLIEASFSHPAKGNKGLSFKIAAHAFECGWLKAGDTCIDPFLGIGGFVLPLILRGVNIVGIELEPKHHATAQANLEFWKRRYATMPNLGDAVLLQGDSRTLLTWGHLEPRRGAECVVGSPPFANMPLRNRNTKKLETLQRLVESGHVTGREFVRLAEKGFNPNTQIGKQDDYGTSPGQLAAMREGSLAAAVGSPPYENSANCVKHPNDVDCSGHGGPLHPGRYSFDGVNLGNQSGDTFWAGTRTILDNCFRLIRPGGHAIWVLGPYVRKGQLVAFPDQWRQVCEAAGFRTLHIHRCPKVETYGTQRHLDGGETTKTIHRTSFFRTLANRRNGSAQVLYEDVLCTEKP